MMVALAMDIKNICDYQMLAENVTMSAVRYFKFSKRLTDHCIEKESMQSSYLMTTLVLIAMFQLLPGLGREMSGDGFSSLVLPI